MTKKEVLQHLIDIYYENLLGTQIDFEIYKEKIKNASDLNQFEIEGKKSGYLNNIELCSQRIEIAKKMLKEL